MFLDYSRASQQHTVDAALSRVAHALRDCPFCHSLESIVARITVEDCLTHIDNRFELALAAALRARQLSAGHQPLIAASKKDKPVVIALREIAEQRIDRSLLRRVGL